MIFFTDFADQAVMLPLAVVIAGGLALARWWRGLLAWLLAVIGVLGTMAVLKYVFFACAGPLIGLGIQSPSGHTAASVVIYGGAMLMLFKGRLATPALAAVPPSVAVTFGASRLALGAHNLAEVLMGGTIGLAGVTVLVCLAGPRPSMRTWPIAVAASSTIALCHGSRLQAEDAIHNFAFFTSCSGGS